MPEETRILCVAQLQCLTGIARGLTTSTDDSIEPSFTPDRDSVSSSRNDPGLVELREGIVASVENMVKAWPTDTELSSVSYSYGILLVSSYRPPIGDQRSRQSDHRIALGSDASFIIATTAASNGRLCPATAHHCDVAGASKYFDPAVTTANNPRELKPTTQPRGGVLCSRNVSSPARAVFDLPSSSGFHGSRG